MFISFHSSEDKCNYCGLEFSKTIYGGQKKYCKNCLTRYTKDLTDHNIYLDVKMQMILNVVNMNQDIRMFVHRIFKNGAYSAQEFHIFSKSLIMIHLKLIKLVDFVGIQLVLFARIVI